MLNKNKSLLQEETQHFIDMFQEYGPRPFADDQQFPKVFIASLMRSGSTFFRNVFQQVTGT
jgi:hypothetical protein